MFYNIDTSSLLIIIWRKGGGWLGGVGGSFLGRFWGGLAFFGCLGRVLIKRLNNIGGSAEQKKITLTK
jgi:hypothetical protein